MKSSSKKTAKHLFWEDARLRSLLENMTEGFSLYQVVEGKDGSPVDYRFLEVNAAFEKHTGLKRKNILNKLRSTVLGGGDPQFTKVYDKVAKKGIPIRFTDYSKKLERYYNIIAFRPEKQRIITLLSDITQQKQEDAAKNNFIAIMAHELRNPLTPILTNIEMLDLNLSKSAPRTNPKMKEAVEIITRQTKTLGKLLDDLLDVSRIIRGKLILHKQPVNLCRLIENVAETTKPLLKAQKHRFSYFCPASQVYVNADPIRIEQVLTNLLNNAAKYTKPGGRISLRVVKKPDATVLIKVRDNGIGIKPRDMNKMFELFMQFSKPFVEAHGGIGIGLKIIKDIVTMHGGTVTVKSAGIGKGSEFTVSLPAIPAIVETPPNKKFTIDGVKRKILVVDDNKDVSVSLCRLLEHLGHKVKIADDGKSAFSAAKNFKPEIVLLDIGLPDMTGYEVAQGLRTSHGEKIKIIALSGYGQEKDKVLSKKAGFDYHLTKPVSMNEINRTIKNVFSDYSQKNFPKSSVPLYN